LDKIEYLLTCLMEECSEIQKAASKSQRFGLNDSDPFVENSQTNLSILRFELADLQGVCEELQEHGVDVTLPEALFKESVKQKRERLKRFYTYSEERGRLQQNSTERKPQ